MRLLSITSALLALLLLPSSALAQERVPAAGSSATGFDIGVFIPRSDELSSSLLLNGNYEYYITPRVSVRGGIGWWNPGFAIGAVESLRQMPLTVDAQYNWERGKWHPFVGGGIGMYFLKFRSDLPSDDDTDTKFGFNTGGGIEYFLNRTVAVKGEGRYHAVDGARGEETGGTALTVGLKTFF